MMRIFGSEFSLSKVRLLPLASLEFGRIYVIIPAEFKSSRSSDWVAKDRNSIFQFSCVVRSTTATDALTISVRHFLAVATCQNWPDKKRQGHQALCRWQRRNVGSVEVQIQLTRTRSALPKKQKFFFPTKRPQGRLPAIAEVALAGLLVIAGVMLMAITVTVTAMQAAPDQQPISTGYLWLRVILATSLITVGGYFITSLLWRVGISRERREALVNRAGEIDLLNEFRRRREDLPTVPIEPPLRGSELPFGLHSSRRNLWSLVSSAVMSLTLVAIASILFPTAIARGPAADPQSVAFVFLPIICVAAIWFLYRFFRQLLKLTGIGPSSIELSHYPLFPGSKCRLRLFQPGRIKLKVLTVWLVCQEEATFDQGTDIRTERRDVFRQRLFRKRSVDVSPDRPFIFEFDLQIPPDAIHSFRSANNRIQWKIIVQAEAKNWPTLNRTFRLSVYPRPVSETRYAVTR